MVAGFESFKNWFQDYEKEYVKIYVLTYKSIFSFYLCQEPYLKGVCKLICVFGKKWLLFGKN